MSTNYYLKTPRRIGREVSQDYADVKERIAQAFAKRGINLASEKAREDFLQEVLDILGVSEVSVVDHEYERSHIGKTAAAGLYCHECGVSLVTGQPGGLNAASPHKFLRNTHECCPRCGAAEGDSCVRGTHSFSYGMSPEDVAALPAGTIVRDQYGHDMTIEDFRQTVIKTAGFVFTDSVDTDFS